MHRPVNERKIKKILALLLLCVLIVATLLCIISMLQNDANDSIIVSIKSESFALKGENPKLFLYKPINVTRVYQYDVNGEVIEYEEGVDYLIVDGAIRRTNDSRIPDYCNHSVLLDSEGYFAFTPYPRNPELNVDFQVLVDYTTKIDDVVIKPKGNLKIKEKLKSGENIKLFLCGDSISAGAQTTGLYYFDDHISTTFLGYLRDFIETNYDVKVDAELFGQNGVSSYYLLDNIDVMIAEQPDIVLIEFGMNDHVADNSMSESSTQKFETNIRSSVEQLKASDIEVMLIGFFQQNPNWELESVEATNKYNDIIEKVAIDEEIPFIDIYQAFRFIDERQNKDMYEDLMADYMHHPTDFGHKVYFSELVPYFIDENLGPIDNYIY